MYIAESRFYLLSILFYLSHLVQDQLHFSESNLLVLLTSDGITFHFESSCSPLKFMSNNQIQKNVPDDKSYLRCSTVLFDLCIDLYDINKNLQDHQMLY